MSCHNPLFHTPNRLICVNVNYEPLYAGGIALVTKCWTDHSLPKPGIHFFYTRYIRYMLEKFLFPYSPQKNTFESDLREILKWQWSQNPVITGDLVEIWAMMLRRLTGMRAAEVPLLPVEAFRDTRL